MAKYKNTFGEERWLPLIGKAVEDGETFEIPDAIARQNDFSAFETVEEPEAIEPPTDDAPRSEWVAFAVEHYGVLATALEPLDRAELVARFGNAPEPELVPPPLDAPRDVWVSFVVDNTPATVEDLADFDTADLIAAVVDVVPAAYDPANYGVKEVVAHLETVDDVERERILAAERAGKNRTTIVGASGNDNEEE